ncbi:unnamed protein product [Peronospora destructor]|uniref:Uncharacterized protein n=1 Tax=Peronospora destructor TaxID=86335 RepID=A0AAV0VB95_9STRA|nr:unnamed protein product [Peronospora destructor]
MRRRNWRGEIIEPNVALSDDAAKCCLNTTTSDSETAICALNISSNGMEKEEQNGVELTEGRSVEKKVFRKDEFGRDVEGESDTRS